jgi:phosphopantothenoylcysteine synthetase/decarboxylase
MMPAQPPVPTTVYYLVSGATSAWRAHEIVPGLLTLFDRALTIPTPNAARVISSYDLARIPGNLVIESYLDSQIRPRPIPAPVVFAPCSFNSLNKLAHGIADNLALSIASEMLGLGQPILVAVSVNEGLWAHPAARAAVGALRNWGMTVIEPRATPGGLSLAPTDELLNELSRIAPARRAATPHDHANCGR